MTHFVKLNDGWNAEPNDPDPRISLDGNTLRLEFTANGFQFPDFGEDERLSLLFEGVTRYRSGRTNDEGWYRGQCRFSSRAPAWGEFYEVSGDLKLDEAGDDWSVLDDEPCDEARHFLFYLRDETFECTARAWTLVRGVAS